MSRGRPLSLLLLAAAALAWPSGAGAPPGPRPASAQSLVQAQTARLPTDWASTDTPQPDTPRTEMPRTDTPQSDPPSTAPDLGASFAELGRFGGRATAVAIDRGLAFAGLGRQLAVFDVSRPGEWTPLGASATLPGTVRAIELSGHYAYAGIWDPPSLVSLDVADPARPRVLATLALSRGRIFDLALAGDYLYAALGSRLAIVDLHDPARPMLAREQPDGVVTVDVDRDRLYATSGFFSNVGLVMSLADPGQPITTADFQVEGSIMGMSVIGTHAYVLDISHDDGSTPMLDIFDLRDPGQPVPVGRQRLAGVDDATLRPAAVPGHLYVIASGRRFDAPDRPVAIIDLDLADPAAPLVARRFELPGELLSAVAIRDGRAYLALGAGGLAAVDLGRPGDGRFTGRFLLPEPARGYAARGGLAYAATRTGVMIIDLRDPSRPRLLGAYASPADDEVTALALAGNRVHLAYRAGEGPGAARRPGLAVIDVADPRRPDRLGFFETPFAATAVAVGPDHQAYLVAGPGLRVIDAANPARPREVAAVRTVSVPRQVAVQADRLYLSYDTPSTAALEILDVHDPADPSRLSLTRLTDQGGGRAGELALGQDIAYLVLEGRELLVGIDVSDPRAPRVVSEFPLSSFGRTGLTQHGRYAYLAFFNAEFHSVLQQNFTLGRVGMEVLDLASGAPRFVWGTESFGSPLFVDGIGLAEGPDGELITLRPLGPPGVFLPLALNLAEAVPTPTAERGDPATPRPDRMPGR